MANSIVHLLALVMIEVVDDFVTSQQAKNRTVAKVTRIQNGT